MKCPDCASNIPDPKPVVIEKLIEVEVGEDAMYTRVYTRVAVCAVLIALCISSCVVLEKQSEERTLQKAIENPTIKIEVQEWDNGRPTRKMTR